MSKKVVITDSGFADISAEKRVLESAGFGVSRVEPGCKTEEDIINCCGDADVLLVQWAPITRRVLEALPRVKCIVRYGIGVNNFDLDAARDLGVAAANVPDYCLEEVSNHALAMILSLSRRIPQDNYQMAHGGWGAGPFMPISALSEMTLGLLSFGNIARAVARKALCLGFAIRAYDPYVREEIFANCGVARVDFDGLLRESDIISIHCPLVPETQHLIDREAIEKMKDGVIVVNTSRGPLVSEEDLIEALDSGKIGGAGLDVYEIEPLPADSPLRGRSNVLLTSHAASASTRAEALLQILPAEAARDFLQGKRPRSALVWHDHRGCPEGTKS